MFITSDHQQNFVHNEPEILYEFPGNPVYPGRVGILMERVIKDEDDQAFSHLFAHMYRPLCQFCCRFVRVREVAEELVSDVFLTVWESRARLNVTSHRSYLFTAVRNRGLDYLRKAKGSRLCDLGEAYHIPVSGPAGEDIIIEAELYSSLQRGIAALPAQCRLIFEMSRDRGMKYREIASALNISIKTVETQMGRALKRLQGTVRKSGC